MLLQRVILLINRDHRERGSSPDDNIAEINARGAWRRMGLACCGRRPPQHRKRPRVCVKIDIAPGAICNTTERERESNRGVGSFLRCRFRIFFKYGGITDGGVVQLVALFWIGVGAMRGCTCVCRGYGTWVDRIFMKYNGCRCLRVCELIKRLCNGP